ncbi:DUF6036 family nucleotidyltransferase [Acidithiobacillus sp.]|uniref:DUF6036 family nucleotidyltransferase n=1 Tax=Acidithiobacillus sp. TaxID=1872118 RepID=UPI003CFF25D3
MTEQELEHLIRASGAILGDNAVYIIGSQSILPWLRKFAGKPPRSWPGIFTLSTEADIIPIDNDQRKSDLIDGTIGEDSYFHNTYGYYAQGVSMETAIAPASWQSRCFPIQNANTREIIGYCMHPLDLFIAKSIANREKDMAFLDAMIEHELVQEITIRHLIPKIENVSKAEIQNLQDRIHARFQRVLAPTPTDSISKPTFKP